MISPDKKLYFETIKCEDYEIYNLDYHIKRVSRTIGLNIDLTQYIYPPNEKLLRCKLIYDDEGVKDVQYFEYKKREINSFKLVYDESIEYSSKYLNRTTLDKLYDKKNTYNEIIIVKNNMITDTSIANIAIYTNGIWLTPLKPLLKGTTRERLLKEEKIFEKDICVEELKKAKKIALMNAMIDFDIITNYSFCL